MRKYLMIKNGMLALLTASIYYSFILECIPMLKRIFGTLVIFTILVVALSKVDEIVLEDMEEKEKSTSGRDTMMRSGNQFN